MRPAYKEEAEQGLGDVVDGGSCEMDSKMVKQSGDSVPMMLHVNPMADGTGGAALWLGTLKEDSEPFCIETDTAKDVNLCNAAACEVLGYDNDEEVLGRPCVSDVVAPEDDGLRIETDTGKDVDVCSPPLECHEANEID